MADSTVKVNFIGDSSSLKKASDDAHGHLGKLASGIGEFAKVAAVGIAAAGVGLAVFGKSAIDAASDLGESLSKVNVVFGKSAKDVEKWAQTASTSMGMTKQAALEAAGTFGNFLIAMGNAPDAAKDMSKEMVQLAADIASFNNVASDEVLLALRSGLAGEAEPLRKFGVNLSAARIEAMGASVGIKKLQKDMTGAEKSTLAYMVIMKDTALAQGDFARTSDGLANRTRILKAQFGDIQAEIGTKLLPIAVALAGFMGDKLIPAFGKVSEIVGRAVSAFGEAFTAQEKFGEWEAHGVIEKLGVIAAQVFGWIKENVPPILAAIGEFINEQVIPALQALGGWIRDDLQPALGKMVDAFKKDLWPTLEEDVIPALIKLGNWLKDELAPRIGALAVIILQDIIPAFFKLVKFIDEEVVPKIMAIVGPIAKIVEIVDKLTSALFGHGGDKFDPLGGWQPSGETFLGPDGKPVFGAMGESFVAPGGKRAGFAMGGMVGGQLGAPQLAVVHGGERVLTPAQQRGGGQTFIFEMNGREFARAIVDESTRSGGLPIRIRAAS